MVVFNEELGEQLADARRQREELDELIAWLEAGEQWLATDPRASTGDASPGPDEEPAPPAPAPEPDKPAARKPSPRSSKATPPSPPPSDE